MPSNLCWGRGDPFQQAKAPSTPVPTHAYPPYLCQSSHRKAVVKLRKACYPLLLCHLGGVKGRRRGTWENVGEDRVPWLPWVVVWCDGETKVMKENGSRYFLTCP